MIYVHINYIYNIGYYINISNQKLLLKTKSKENEKNIKKTISIRSVYVFQIVQYTALARPQQSPAFNVLPPLYTIRSKRCKRPYCFVWIRDKTGVYYSPTH